MSDETNDEKKDENNFVPIPTEGDAVDDFRNDVDSCIIEMLDSSGLRLEDIPEEVWDKFDSGFGALMHEVANRAGLEEGQISSILERLEKLSESGRQS